MKKRYLWVSTKGEFNFRVPVGEHNTEPDAAIIVNWCQNVMRAGMYYDQEANGVVPWHSIMSVELIDE